MSEVDHFSLAQGDLIQVIEYGAALAPVHDICDLLFSCDTWEQEEPLAFSSSFSHFWVLHDGGSQGIDADYYAINSAYGFQEFVADRLMYAQHRTTMKTARPLIQDAVHKGVVCKAVVLVTECLPTLPIPPARITVPLTVVFLDLRPVLRGLDWRVFPRGEYALALLERGLNLATPPGFDTHIEGGTRIKRNGVVFLQVESCAVLTVSYREQPSAGEPAETSDADDSGSSSDEDSSSDDSGPSSRHRGSTRRSRSRQGRDGARRNKADTGRGGRTVSLSGAKEGTVCSITFEAAPSRNGSLGPDRQCFTLVCHDGSPFAASRTLALPNKDTNPFEGIWAPGIRSSKILIEPGAGSPASSDTVAHLRYTAPRLGVPWRYMTPINAPRIADDDSSEAESEGLQEPALRVCFRILAPGYAAERIEASVTFPTTLAALLPVIQRLRSPDLATNFPRLIPANPQPLVGDGVLLACPVWSLEVAIARRQVCIDCTTLDGRIYSALAPVYVAGADLPGIAKLPGNLAYSIFAGPFGDLLAEDSYCHLTDGDTIIFCPEDARAPRIVPMHVALLGRQHWGREPEHPEPSCHGVCCVVFGEDNILRINSRGRHHAFRSQVAGAIGVQSRFLRIISSQPRVMNAALDGMPCRSVVAVCEEVAFASEAEKRILLDVRGLFLGWRCCPAPHGEISCRAIIDALRAELGNGWRLWLRGIPLDADILTVRDGQVFYVTVLYARDTPVQAQPRLAVGSALISASSDAPDAAPETGGDGIDYTVAAMSGPGTAPDPGHQDQAQSHPANSQHLAGSDDPDEAWDGGLAYIVVPFLLLGQNYVHEWVSVRLAIGTSVVDALNAAAVARCPARAVRLPILCAVHPQPCSTVALTVCLPVWGHEGAIIAIDSRAINGRLFAVQIIGQCRGQDFLRLAGVPEDMPVEVYFRDLPWALPEDNPVLPINGDLVLLRPVTADLHFVSSLADMLQSDIGWATCPVPVENLSDIAWVLGPDGPSALRVPAHRQYRARQEIAQSIGRRQPEAAITPAFGGIADFERLGVIIRNVVVAQPLTGGAETRRGWATVCLLDLRPLLLEFDWVSCSEGIFPTDRILQRLRHRCPPGYCIGRIVHGAAFQLLREPFLVQAGEVVVLVLRRDPDGHHVPIDSPEGPTDDLDGHDQGGRKQRESQCSQ